MEPNHELPDFLPGVLRPIGSQQPNNGRPVFGNGLCQRSDEYPRLGGLSNGHVPDYRECSLDEFHRGQATGAQSPNADPPGAFWAAELCLGSGRERQEWEKWQQRKEWLADERAASYSGQKPCPSQRFHIG